MKISIITINYNNLEGLHRTLDSIASQTYKEFEWIVVDGGSTDGSRELLEESQHLITRWVSEPDKGIYNAMNKGIGMSTGEYLQFLNSGDWLYESTTIEHVLSKGLDHDICFGQMRFHHSNGAESTGGLATANFSIFAMLVDVIPHPSTFIRRKLFERYGFYDESYRICADQEFFWRVILHHNCSVKHLNMIVSHMVDGGISATEGELVQRGSDRMKRTVMPRLYGDDHPQCYNPRDVRKAMTLYNHLRANSLIRIFYHIWQKI